MPEPAAERYQTYAGKTASDAAKALSKLPTESQLAWIKVQPLLLQDPVAHIRTRPMSRDGRLFLYSQSSPPLEVTYQVDNDGGTVEWFHFSAPQLQERSNRLVVVYSEKDKDWFMELRKWIGDFEKNGIIEIWDISMIKKGNPISEEIGAALAMARAALVLVTQDFLHGDLKDDQLKLEALIQAHTTAAFSIQWIAVGTSIWKSTPIAAYQPINDPNKPLSQLKVPDREQAYLAIHGEIEKIVMSW